jgi:type I restriction enzyme R subunit
MLSVYIVFTITGRIEAVGLKPEEEARKKIDELLELAGWIIHDYENLNLGAGAGIAVREYL